MEKERLISIIGVCLLLAIVAAVIIVWGVYSDWFDTNFQQLFVSSGKTKFLQAQNLVLGDVELKVNFVLTKNADYDVRILPTGRDFAFTVDGQPLNYLQIGDLTPAFRIDKNGSKFVLRAKDMSMQCVLEKLYPGRTVEILAVDVDAEPHFKLAVTAGELVAPELSFRCKGDVTDMEIDPDHVFAFFREMY